MEKLKPWWSSLKPDQKRMVAESLGTTLGRIQNVVYGFRPVTFQLAVCIEREHGPACEQLCPAAHWHRVPDASWPWHPQGRPLLDLTRMDAVGVTNKEG